MPIAALLYKSVSNPEVVRSLPLTVEAISAWDGKSLPADSVYKALSQDLAEARRNQTIGDLSKRLNMELAGYRSLMAKTARKLPFKEEPASYKDAMEQLDERWGDPAYWQVIRRNASSYTPYYLLAALDHRIDDLGEVARATPDQAIYLDIFARTFWMGAVITVICLLLAYPLAYLLANLPTRKSNLLMILVLLPFWTSIMVRVAAWIVLLQSGGLINGALLKLGLIDQPLQLVFNRTGVYIAMVHIMLPFMILPIYSVMKGISPSYMRAAISLGCHPFASFWRVYFPQTVAGVGAGCLLVFILSIGYYITPALLGSPNDQMVSYFVAFYTNSTINWGMATALGGLLLLATWCSTSSTAGWWAPAACAWDRGPSEKANRFPSAFGKRLPGGRGEGIRTKHIGERVMLSPYMSPVERLWFYSLRILCGLVLLFLVLPVLVIVPLSFNSGTFLVYPLQGFSLRWYADFFQSAEWMRSLTNSMIVAPAATLLAMVFGTLAAIGLTRGEFRGKALVMSLMISPMVVPVVIIGVASYLFFAPLGLGNSYLSLIVVHAVLGVPFVIITVSATLQGFNYNMVRAAASLGAPPLTTFFRVTLPLIAPGVISGALFAFATSFDEVVVTLFLAGPEQATLPRQMFSGIRENLSPTIAAAATLLIGFSVLLLLTLEWLRGRSEEDAYRTTRRLRRRARPAWSGRRLLRRKVVIFTAKNR